MATLYIAEFTHINPGDAVGAQIAKYPPLVEQVVVIGGGSLASAAFNNQTRFIRVHADAICSIAIATTPTATVTNGRLAADQTEYLGVNPGDKIAVISNT